MLAGKKLPGFDGKPDFLPIERCNLLGRSFVGRMTRRDRGPGFREAAGAGACKRPRIAAICDETGVAAAAVPRIAGSAEEITYTHHTPFRRWAICLGRQLRPSSRGRERFARFSTVDTARGPDCSGLVTLRAATHK